jgi:putative DNA primase/helicase
MGRWRQRKSVFMTVITAILADYASPAPLDTFMETRTVQHPTDIAKLFGARLVSCTETEQGHRWAESKIKYLTGGDKVSARFMQQNFFDFLPEFKLWISGNHKPYIRNVDEAMKRRLHLVPFTMTIPYEKRDKRLAAKLLQERDGILAWMLEGCLEWQRIGLAPPKAVLDATGAYFEEEDSIQQFIDEECVQQARAKTAIEDLFGRWKRRSEGRGEIPGTCRWFVRQMIGRGFVQARLPGGTKALGGLRLRDISSGCEAPAPDEERF